LEVKMKILFVIVGFLFTSWTTAGEAMIVAHRGSSRDAPENTLPAFMLAWEQGADAIEGDFHLTKDGQVVCIHDDNTKRVSHTNVVVRATSLAELRQLDVGVGRWQSFKGTMIPTLSEVFSTIPKQKKIYIEIKCGEEIIPALLSVIDHSGLTKGQIVMISFKEKVIRELKAKAPHYKAFLLCSFNKQKTGEITPSSEAVLSRLKLAGADGLSSNTDIPEQLVEALRSNGYEWHVWTVDDPKTAMRMQSLGARSITTNVPKTLRAALVEQSSAGDSPKAAHAGSVMGACPHCKASVVTPKISTSWDGDDSDGNPMGGQFITARCGSCSANLIANFDGGIDLPTNHVPWRVTGNITE
jgi:glycerophosphoryl diester phosphodiesterase